MSYEFLRGINFDTPITFTSMGKNYLLGVVFIFFEKESKELKIQYLDVSMIHTIEWTNEANNLCIGGKLILEDTGGKFGNIFSSTPAFVGIKLALKQEISDEMADGDFFSEPNNSKNNPVEFEHIFIIDKFGIENREKNSLQYVLYLKSTMWLRMISRASFSNCNGKGPEKIYEIIKKILNDAFLDFEVLKGKKLIFSKSFDKIYSGENTICKPYITFANDSVFDALRFLQSRLYFNFRPGEMASGISYLRFNEFDNSLGVIDFDGSTIPEEGILDGTLVSLDALTFEQFVSVADQKFSSLNNLGFLSFIMNFFGYTNFIREFPMSDEKVEDKIVSVEPSQMSYFYNQKDYKFEPDKKFNLENMKEFIFGDNGIFPKYLDYKNEYSNSNIYTDTYFKMFEILKNRDIIIFETNGKFGHVPGMLFQIIGRNKEPSNSFDENSPSDGEADINRNITGLFHVLKTVHILQPKYGKEGEKFRERLYLTKTWTSYG